MSATDETGLRAAGAVRLEVAGPTAPTAAARLEEVRRACGRVPAMVRHMASAPALLEAYLASEQALSGGQVPMRLREQIALGCATHNDCAYCSAAHALTGRMSGLPAEQIVLARRWRSGDPAEQALLTYAHEVLTRVGAVSDDVLDDALAAGWTPTQLQEVVGHVALNVLTNSYNRLVRPELDWSA